MPQHPALVATVILFHVWLGDRKVGLYFLSSHGVKSVPTKNQCFVIETPFWEEASAFLCTQKIPFFLWANSSLLSTRWREKASNFWPKTQPKLFPPTCRLWKGKYHSVTLGSRVMVTPTLAWETQRSPHGHQKGGWNPHNMKGISHRARIPGNHEK